MLHYDEHSGVISYFRPSLINVVNKVFDRDFKKYNIFQGLFKLALARFSGWSFSFWILTIAYIIMLGGGYFLGTYVPWELLIILVVPLLYLMIYNVFFQALFHAVVLGTAISFMGGMLEFIIPSMAIFLIARLVIDIPHFQMMKGFYNLHEHIIIISAYGFQFPLTVDDKFLETIDWLTERQVDPKKIFKAYVYGHYLSKNDKYQQKEIVDFIKSVWEVIDDKYVRQ